LLEKILPLIFDFCFFYPLYMSWLWIVGSLFYYYRYEKKYSNPTQIPTLSSYPFISLVVPCFNEADNIVDTITNLLNQRYPHFDIIAVNDCSQDETGNILDALALKHPQLRVIHHAKNQGKSVALTSAAILTNSEFILCIDGDALLDHNAALWMLTHFLNNSRVGAVTGNPRLRTRTSILGRIQVGEFSSIIGMIKRAQRTYGRLFTVSGVCVMFRKSALANVGFWSIETLTDDIDISWKLQIQHWEIRFEPAATCWILMPETFKGLWSQRLRWATGGAQAILKFLKIWRHWNSRRMWPIFVEYVLSLLWSYSMLLYFLLYMAQFFFTLPEEFIIETLLPRWAGLLIAFTSMTQIAIAMKIDARYDHQLWRNYFYAIWYPIAFWILSMLTTLVAFPRALFRDENRLGKWDSPDRGLN